MGVLSEKRLQQVGGLVKTLPVGILRQLNSSLSLSQDAALTQVRNLVARELEAHTLKEQVFRPFVPLFMARDDGIEGVIFPNWVLSRLWRVLQTEEKALVEEARVLSQGLRADDPVPVPFFRLVNAGAELIRARPEAVLAPDADEDDADELEEFAAYLDLHRLLREALARLPDWMGRIDAEKAAAIRLMFKDASDKTEDGEGGVRFLEAMLANMDDATLVMKFVATVSDRANDRFLSESELASFGERLLKAAEERLKVFEGLMRRRDASLLGEAGGWVAQCLGILNSLQQSVELTRDGPWGKRAVAIHQSVNALVEERLKGVEKVISQALPLKTERIFGRATREVPDYAGPKPAQAETALQTVAFLNQIRPTAAQGGYASLLAKTVQSAELLMDAYFNVVLGIAVADDPFDPDAVMSCFDRVIPLMDGLLGEAKGNLARRRVASADVFRAPKTIA
ncbi:hypothetical protein [Asticcacaulis sp. AND118]|uniref:hypothetical protein n=1 Tax=Asticcacaulis sp. AND118 TaxID=2840468 RepID=UPI001D000970|nr:hypothetical protein [Asticcacaulis sp. AND118]UDF03217.1 hypothetical protein LH365_12345 [Asticcacaulis sp. AND118]